MNDILCLFILLFNFCSLINTSDFTDLSSAQDALKLKTVADEVKREINNEFPDIDTFEKDYSFELQDTFALSGNAYIDNLNQSDSNIANLAINEPEKPIIEIPKKIERLSITLPSIGTFKVIKGKDPQTGKAGFYFDSKNVASKSPGLIYNEVHINLSEKQVEESKEEIEYELSIFISGSIIGKNVDFTLRSCRPDFDTKKNEISISTLVLGISYKDNKIIIPISDEKSFELQRAILILKDGKQPIIASKVIFKGQPAVIRINYQKNGDKQIATYGFYISTMPLASLIKSLQGTDFANITLKNNKFVVTVFQEQTINKQPAKFLIDAASTADLSTAIKQIPPGEYGFTLRLMRDIDNQGKPYNKYNLIANIGNFTYKNLEIQEAELLVDPIFKDFKIFAKINFLDINVDVIISKISAQPGGLSAGEPGQLKFNLNFRELPITKLVKSLNNTPLSGLILRNVSIEIVAKKSQNLDLQNFSNTHIDIRGTADFSTVSALSSIIPSGQLEIGAIIDSESLKTSVGKAELNQLADTKPLKRDNVEDPDYAAVSFSLFARLSDLSVPGFTGKINNARLDLYVPLKQKPNIKPEDLKGYEIKVEFDSQAQLPFVGITNTTFALPLTQVIISGQKVWKPVIEAKLEVDTLTYKGLTLKQVSTQLSPKTNEFGFTARTNIFGIEMQVNLERAVGGISGITATQSVDYNIKVNIDEIPFNKIIPALQNTPLSGLSIENFAAVIETKSGQDFDLNNFYNTNVTISGEADFSKIPALANVIPSGKLRLEAIIGKESIQSPTVEDVLLRKIDADQKSPGSGFDIIIPEDEKVDKNALNFSLVAKLSSFNISGVDLNKISGMTVKDAHLEFYCPIRKTSGDARGMEFGIGFDTTISDKNLGNFDATFKLDINQIIEQKKSKVGLKLFGTFSNPNLQFKPFQNISKLKDLNVTISKPTLGLTLGAGSYSLDISGTVSILGQNFSGKLVFGTQDGKPLVVVKAIMPANWKISDTIKNLKGTVCDDLELRNGQLIAATEDYQDAELNEKINTGLSLYADFDNIRFGSSDINKLLGKKSSAIILGTLSPDPSELELVIKFVTNQIPFKTNVIKNASMELGIKGNKLSKIPEIVMGLSMDIQPGPQEPVLKCSINGAYDPTPPGLIKLAGGMAGCWNDPFSVRGLSICDLGLGLSINPALFASTGLPSGFAIQGGIKFSQDRVITTKVDMDVTKPYSSVIIGNLTCLKNINPQCQARITLAELVNFVISLAKNASASAVSKSDPKLAADINTVLSKGIPDKDIPDIYVEDILVSIVPQFGSITIAGVTYQPGFGLGGTINVLGSKAYINCSLSFQGLIAEGYLTDTNITDILIIRKSEKDTKHSKYNGPYLSLELTPKEQHFYVSGFIEIIGVLKSDTNIEISKSKGVSISIDTKLFNQFDAQFNTNTQGRLGKVNNSDFYVEIIFSDNGNLCKQAQAAILKGIDQMNKDFEKFAVKANSDLDKAIGDIKKERARQQKIFDDATADVQRRYNKAMQDLQPVKKAYEDMESKYKKAVDEWNHLSSLKKSYRWVDLGSKIAGLKIASGSALAAYKSAKGIVDTFEKDLGKAAVSGSAATAKAFLDAGQNTVDYVARQFVNTVLKGSKDVVYESGKFVANKVLDVFRIEMAKFSGSLQEIKDGMLPRLELVLIIADKKTSITVQFNAKNVDASMLEISNKAKDKFLALR